MKNIKKAFFILTIALVSTAAQAYYCNDCDDRYRPGIVRSTVRGTGRVARDTGEAAGDVARSAAAVPGDVVRGVFGGESREEREERRERRREERELRRGY